MIVISVRAVHLSQPQWQQQPSHGSDASDRATRTLACGNTTNTVMSLFVLLAPILIDVPMVLACDPMHTDPSNRVNLANHPRFAGPNEGQPIVVFRRSSPSDERELVSGYYHVPQHRTSVSADTE